MPRLTIATRGSQLALWQANHIRDCLLAQNKDLTIELSVIHTKGDKILDVPLSQVGGKGLFVKEIEETLLSGEADLAVHSIKDVPMVLPEGLTLGAIPERAPFTDCLCSEKYASLDEVPEGATVGTSSLRRQAQLLALRPDLNIVSLRGNVDTRLRKLKEGQFAAIVLATAGLRRLGLSATHMTELDPKDFVPAVGQGALGIECRSNDAGTLELLARLNDSSTRTCVEAERAFLLGLDGGCQVPIGAHAVLADNGMVTLDGLVADTDGSKILRRQATAPAAQAHDLGVSLAKELLGLGADAILARLYGDGTIR
ncbi:MAG: hydroxymethylbilane synthase [Desulfovibrionaceae bacterium]|nr:hydroxymethylbilane synthase [Desulfovibrionaceae bacterium]